MPVIPDPSTPPATSAGLIWSDLSAAASVTTASVGCNWWLIIPERPDLSVPLALVRPAAGGGSLPSGDAAWEATRDVAEGVHHTFNRERAIVTHGNIQGEELDLSAVFIGEDAFDAFNAARESFLTGLLQSDQVGRQWYVDLGSQIPRAVPQLQNRPDMPHYVVTLHVIEVDAP